MVKKQEDDEYELVLELVDETAHVYVYEPIITKEERDRRIQEAKEAFQIFVKDYYRRKAIREREEARLSRNT